MKFSFVISDFLEEILSLSHSVVFLYFFALNYIWLVTKMDPVFQDFSILKYKMLKLKKIS